MYEWSEVEMWKNSEDNSEVVRSERWEEGNEVATWEKQESSEQGRWMEFKDKIVSYCSRESKCKQGFTAEITKMINTWTSMA